MSFYFALCKYTVYKRLLDSVTINFIYIILDLQLKNAMFIFYNIIAFVYHKVYNTLCRNNLPCKYLLEIDTGREPFYV